nr:hypothetical protein [Paenibacillus polymyxa]
MYFHNDWSAGNTVVEIKDGVAKAVWQFTSGNGLDDIVSSAIDGIQSIPKETRKQ